MAQDMDWLPRTQRILGHLGDVELRLQSRTEVPPDELKQVEEELGELRTMAARMGLQTGAGKLLESHTHGYTERLQRLLKAAGAAPLACPPSAAEVDTLAVMTSVVEAEKKKDQVTAFVCDVLFPVVQQLESGGQVGDDRLQPVVAQLEEMADAVRELAPGLPQQLPAYFERLRERLRVQLANRG